MLEIFSNFSNQEAGIQIATLGIFGGFLVALVNLFTKYIELSFNRKKEIFQEKLKEVSRIRSVIKLMTENFTDLSISEIRVETDRYIRNNNSIFFDISEAISADERRKSSENAIKFYNGLRDEIEKKFPLNADLPKKALEIVLDMSPYLITRDIIVNEFIEFTSTADLNRVNIANAFNKSVRDSEKAMRELKPGMNFDDSKVIIDKALDILTSELKVKFLDLPSRGLHSSLENEILSPVYLSRIRLIFYRLFYSPYAPLHWRLRWDKNTKSH